MRRVDPKVYTREYFESDCGGHELWKSTKGRILPPRLAYAWKLAQVKPGDKVLDWGCGRGELSWHSASAGAKVLGLDYSAEAIALTRKLPKLKRGQMQFRQIKSTAIPAPDNYFEVIFFVDVIEHMYPEELAELIQEFARVLAPGGKVVLHTFPNKDHYDYGYPYFTRFAQMLINPWWQRVFGERLRDEPSPRFGYDLQVHINECSKEMVEKYFAHPQLQTRCWYDSWWRMIRRRDQLRYLICQPHWLLPRYFADDIWAVVMKKPLGPVQSQLGRPNAAPSKSRSMRRSPQD